MFKKYGELIHYDIIYQGILKKAPPQKPKVFFNFLTKFSCSRQFKSSSFLLERWRKRHFVLYKTFRPSDVYLIYFKADPSLECKNIGSINLEKLTNVSVDVGSLVNKSNVFSIQTVDEKGNDRMYYLCAQSLTVMNTWVNKITTSINFSSQSSRISSISATQSPVNTSYVRSASRVKQKYISTPKLNSAMWSTHTSPEPQRFSFSNLNEHSNENLTSYYNLSPTKSPLSQERLEDPISTEEEDIYKYPCENPNSHAYVNLEDEESTPIATKTNSAGDLFFGNDENILNINAKEKSVDIPTFQEYKYPVDDLVFDYKDLSSYQSDHNLQKDSSDKKSLDEDVCNFDFPLPTRIKSESSSSSSSSSCSSSNEDLTDCQLPIRKPKAHDVNHESLQNPPQVPKRLNLPEIINGKKTAPSETVLPVKTPKAYFPKTDNHTPFDEQCLTALNYLDAENLLLDNRKDSFGDSIAEPKYVGCFMAPSLSNHSILSSDLRFTDINTSRDHSIVYSNDEAPPSSLLTFAKDLNPLVEYREICDARTEALLKLHVRILNNE